ncbi:hypothetical protein HYN69_18390 (plasmid) [Gemmobacter aquarius]|uniref:Calcineurin-like phosphoesterase domain-containing protein n=2 Tax=Paragemmobacter aquarius TaxID=2169400 RepID=A0A2S0US04_9RHOB|nr:hypothetical protein HYN69_18390 [Gemmobacter aquarius]
MIAGLGFLDRFRRKPAHDSVRIVDLGRMEQPVYAIGDVHGCRALLALALDAIRQDADVLGKAPKIILLGDVIDRGEDSAGVLDDLTRVSREKMPTVVLGNHERMMLSFLRDPLKAWDWLQQGGFETLRSYGLVLSPTEKPNARRLMQMLQAHIPDHHIDWLQGLAHGYRLQVNAKTYVLTHAGLDAARPVEAQSEAAVLWGHNVSPEYPGLCMVQGHIVVDRPLLSDCLIRIDTGAHVSGRLSVLRLSDGRPPSVMSFGGKTL